LCGYKTLYTGLWGPLRLLPLKGKGCENGDVHVAQGSAIYTGWGGLRDFGRCDGRLRGMSAPPISMVLTTYNHERFIGEAVQSALDQRYPNLEVVISDDGSTDGTWDVICEVVGRYKGPHTVVTHRQPDNVGPAANTFHALSTARGRFHVRAHGDDLSMPDRVAKVVALWQRTGATLITHNALQATGLGQPVKVLRPPGRTEQLSLDHICGQGWTSQMLGATFSWDPKLFQVFGPIDRTRLERGGDHVWPLRAALLTGFWYLDEPLLLWRQHPDQMTRKTADFTGSTHVVGETLTAYDLAPQLQRLRDVRKVGRPDLARAENLVLQMIVNTAASWRMHRAKLMAEGMALTWVPRDGGPAVADAAERQGAEALVKAVDTVLFVHRSPAGPQKGAQLRHAVRVLVERAEVWSIARQKLQLARLKPVWA